MEILKHRLVDGGVQHLVCRKNSRKLSGSDMIVVHYTAGTSARTAAEFLAKEEVKASAHLVIGRQGELFQLVPFDTEAWHAGRSCYGGRANLNRYSIGSEFKFSYIKEIGATPMVITAYEGCVASLLVFLTLLVLGEYTALKKCFRL